MQVGCVQHVYGDGASMWKAVSVSVGGDDDTLIRKGQSHLIIHTALERRECI